jgi:AcrR family transcriptional regulator
MPRPSDPLARSRLLNAARKVFVEKGLDRAKVEDITQAAGLSKGAFYLHFESKEQAFKEILSEALQEVEAAVRRGRQEHQRSYEKGLEQMLVDVLERDIQTFEVLWKHRAIMGLVMLDGGGSADYQHLTEMFVQRIEKQVEELIDFGIERGYYRADIDPPSAAAFCSGAYDRMACVMLRDKKRPDFRSLLRQLHLYVMHAFGTPELIEIAERVYRDESVPVSSVSGEEPAEKTSRLA